VSRYYSPKTVSEAVDILADANACLAAGCTDLFPATEFQNLQGSIIDITGIAEISGISAYENGWRIGAATPWGALHDADLPAAFNGLKQAAGQVGSAQIQNAGTIGGNLCNASPAADGVPPLMILDAQVELASKAGVRRMPLADFITGPRQTALRLDEMMTALYIPASASVGTSTFVKLGARKYMVISITMAAARVVIQRGFVADIAISIGSCGPVARRLKTMETALLGQKVETLSARFTRELVTPELSPISDIRANKDYRITAAVEIVKRTVLQAARAENE